MDVQSNFDETRPGGRQSLVQHFAIEGLFGYRTLSLHSEYAATVLIARNGAGKTTMLGALDAFLRCQFGRIAEITFKRITCKLRNLPQALILEKDDLDAYIRAATESSELQHTAKVYEIDFADLLFFVLWEYPHLNAHNQLTGHPVFQKIYHQQTFTLETATKYFDRLSKAVEAPFSPISTLRKVVSNALADIEIVYLPTYRRIELSLPEPDENRSPYGRKTKTIHERLGLHQRGLHAGDIQFGLADIRARLKKLNQEIMVESNQKYAEISANIIDDLISGSFEQRSPSLEERPSREELTIFFERMKAGREWHFGPYYGPYGPIKIPDLDQVYSGNIPENSVKFLTYFLGKLNAVIQKTRETERMAESFVENCNKYLSAHDSSTDIQGAAEDDEKILKLDRASLDVSVWRKRASRQILLDALSSGEKQMISLFARLYLYPKEKIVLVDEPELSLSIDWQRKILPDILNASQCRQVIAITHSPFIFDNELDMYATALQLTISDHDSSSDQE